MKTRTHDEHSACIFSMELREWRQEQMMNTVLASLVWSLENEDKNIWWIPQLKLFVFIINTQKKVPWHWSTRITPSTKRTQHLAEPYATDLNSSTLL